ncbi:type VI secretion system tube protein Hcp [Salmonella enterica]|nr:type VI secretion system tube protein Hcp [Salmonella enterica]
MATNLFMKIDGIDGQSSDSLHKGWIEIEGFTFGAHNNNRMGDSYYPQLTTSSSQATPVTVSKAMDNSSTEICKRVLEGTEVKKIELVSCVMQQGKVTDHAKIELEKCSITSCNFAVDAGDGHIYESVVISYGKVTIAVTPLKDKDGKACGKAVMDYDFIENKTSAAAGG